VEIEVDDFDSFRRKYISFQVIQYY
jgi:hypothetical protein